MRRTLFLSLLACRDALLLAGDALFRVFHSGPRSPRGDVVFVRMDGIGDFVLWLDSARHFRGIYPGRRIVLICSQAWSDLARCFSHFDEVIPVEARRFRVDLRYRYKMLGSLLTRRYGLLVNPVFSRLGFSDAEAIVRVLRADVKIGSEGDRATGWRGRLGGLWYSKLVPASGEPLMELERNAEFMCGLTGQVLRPNLPRIPAGDFPTPNIDIKDYYILFPGAASALRQWPAGCFAEVARQSYKWSGLTGLVCGGPGDRQLADRIIEEAGVPLRNWAGNTTLPEFVGLLARANFMVTNETGAVHIAAAVSTPCVSITGGGHFGRFVPYPVECGAEGPLPVVASHEMSCFHCNWDCIYPVGQAAPAPCVSAVTAEEVMQLVETSLLRV